MNGCKLFISKVLKVLKVESFRKLVTLLIRYNMDVRIQAPGPLAPPQSQQQQPRSGSMSSSSSSTSLHQQQPHNGPPRMSDYPTSSYMNGGLTGVVEHLPELRRNSMSALGGGIGVGPPPTAGGGRMSLMQGGGHMSVPGIRSGIPPLQQHTHMTPIMNQMSGVKCEERNALSS